LSGRLAAWLRPHLVEQRLDPRAAPRARHPIELPVEIEELPALEVIVEVGILGQETDLALDLEVAERAAHEAGRPVRREVDAHEDLDGGRLAGAVGAEKAEDHPFLDGKGEPLERLDAAVAESDLDPAVLDAEHVLDVGL
jgi:hypothetical protein